MSFFRRLFGGDEPAAPTPAVTPNPAAAPSPEAETATVRKIVARLEELPPDRARLLAGAAYVVTRAANADLEVTDEEAVVIERALVERTGITEAEAVIVVEVARQQARLFGSTEDYLVTREFKRVATPEQRLGVMRACFLVAAADDEISSPESAVLNHRHRARDRPRRLRRRAGRAPGTPLRPARDPDCPGRLTAGPRRLRARPGAPAGEGCCRRRPVQRCRCRVGVPPPGVPPPARDEYRRRRSDRAPSCVKLTRRRGLATNRSVDRPVLIAMDDIARGPRRRPQGVAPAAGREGAATADRVRQAGAASPGPSEARSISTTPARSRRAPPRPARRRQRHRAVSMGSVGRPDPWGRCTVTRVAPGRSRNRSRTAAIAPCRSSAGSPAEKRTQPATGPRLARQRRRRSRGGHGLARLVGERRLVAVGGGGGEIGGLERTRHRLGSREDPPTA